VDIRRKPDATSTDREFGVQVGGHLTVTTLLATAD
jgi:hypothetical protein